MSQASQMMSPFGGFPMPGHMDMGLAAQTGMLPFLYPGLGGPGFLPGMPSMPMMPPGMMPGNQNMYCIYTNVNISPPLTHLLTNLAFTNLTFLIS